MLKTSLSTSTFISDSTLFRSSLLDYLDNASNILETNPELMNSIGMGPIDTPIVKNLSSNIEFIDDYEGNSNTNYAIEIETQQSCKWIFDLVQGLSGWLYTTLASVDYSQIKFSKLEDDHPTPITITLAEEKEFWSEWEWVLSQTEEIAIQQANKQASQIENELKNLRQTANQLKQRPFFVSQIQYIFSVNNIFDEEQIKVLETISLSASLRSKLLRDVVNQFSDVWLQFIGRKIFNGESSSDEEDSSSKYPIFIENYTEKPYTKNVTGALISMGFVASHGSDQCLTPQVLGDIIWSWWSTLIRAIREITDVSDTLSDALASKVLEAAPVIARVWFDTIENTKHLHNPGSLPEKWKLQEQEELTRLKQLRAVGMVDAKFRDGPSKVGTLHSTISPQKLAEVKRKLEQEVYCKY